jgi:hypothetical protein
VGASPTRQPLQPEAIGAVTEVTKWLKPSISVSRIGDSASVQAATRVTRAAGRFHAGANLYKQVATSGAGSWVLRFQFRGKKRWMGLGPIAVYSLKEATARARAAQQLIYDGVDPVDARRQTRASEARKAILTITFEAAAQAFYDQHAIKWGHKSRTAFTNTMATYVYPVFGKLDVDKIDTALVLRAIEPIWLTRHVTAGRVRSRVEQILAWSAVRGYREGANPAKWDDHLDQLLPMGGSARSRITPRWPTARSRSSWAPCDSGKGLRRARWNSPS